MLKPLLESTKNSARSGLYLCILLLELTLWHLSLNCHRIQKFRYSRNVDIFLILVLILIAYLQFLQPGFRGMIPGLQLGAAIYLVPEMLSEESLFPLKITSLSAPNLSFSNTNSVINCLKLQIISCLWVRGFLDVVLRTYINYLIFVFSQSNHSFQHLI